MSPTHVTPQFSLSLTLPRGFLWLLKDGHKFSFILQNVLDVCEGQDSDPSYPSSLWPLPLILIPTTTPFFVTCLLLSLANTREHEWTHVGVYWKLRVHGARRAKRNQVFNRRRWWRGTGEGPALQRQKALWLPQHEEANPSHKWTAWNYLGKTGEGLGGQVQGNLDPASAAQFSFSDALPVSRYSL